jgi:hypothetical protein
MRWSVERIGARVVVGRVMGVAAGLRFI